MLKIKNNVDLKELEKFGFKPRYDEETGEIYRYVHTKYNDSIYVDSRILNFEQITGKHSVYYKTEIVENLLYDLIKAGLVEKIND